MFHLKKVLCAGSIVAFFMFVFPVAYGAEFDFIPLNSSVGIGDEFKIDIVLHTEGKNINALAGKAIFPTDIFELEKIVDGGSAVALWLERPSEKDPGEITFSGIIPSGFGGATASVFSFYLKALREGKGMLAFRDIKLLLNDGNGSEIVSRAPSSEIRVFSVVSSTVAALPADILPPEPFMPEVSRDPTVFDTNWFVSFGTSDKGVGIDHYEVGEVSSGGDSLFSWTRTESPFLLRDQGLSSDIYVRAVDRVGNFVVAKIPARFPKTKTFGRSGGSFYVLVLLSIALLFLGYVIRLLWRRSRNPGNNH